MDKFNDVEYKSIPTDDECIITAVKVGEEIEEPSTRVRKWAEYHQDNLYIKKINGRFVYTQKSIEQFKFIKDLKFNKGMTHEQIRQYMKKHGLECEKFSSGIINPNDPFGYEVLSSAIAQETENKLKEFMSVFVQYQENNNAQLIQLIKSDVEQIECSIDDRLKLSEKNLQENYNINSENIIKELEEQKEANKKLLEQLNEVKEELALTRDTSIKTEEQLKDNFDNMSKKIIDENRKDLEKLKNDIKYVSQEEINRYQEKSKSWLSKIFNKK